MADQLFGQKPLDFADLIKPILGGPERVGQEQSGSSAPVFTGDIIINGQPVSVAQLVDDIERHQGSQAARKFGSSLVRRGVR